jgi:hypothetical protein
VNKIYTILLALSVINTSGIYAYKWTIDNPTNDKFEVTMEQTKGPGCSVNRTQKIIKPDKKVSMNTKPPACCMQEVSLRNLSNPKTKKGVPDQYHYKGFMNFMICGNRNLSITRTPDGAHKLTRV